MSHPTTLVRNGRSITASDDCTADASTPTCTWKT